MYTKPDETHNRATFVNAALRHAGPAGLAFSGNVYYRDIDTRTFNGDVNEDSLDQSLYQPSAGRARGADCGGVHGLSGLGRQRREHAVSVLALPRQRAAQRRAGREVQRAAQPHADRAAQRAALSGQVTRFGAVGRAAGTSSPPARAFDRSRAGVHAVVAARLPEPRSQHHGRGCVRRRRDGRHRRRRAVRHPRGPRRADARRGASTRPTRCRSAIACARHRCRAATTARRVDNRDGIRPGGEDGLARRRPRVLAPQSRRGRDRQRLARDQPLRRLQRRQPRRHLDRARMRRSRAAVQAAERDGRRSAAGAGRHPHARRRRARPVGGGSPGTPATSAPPTATTSCSCSPSRPGSATSRTSGATRREGLELGARGAGRRGGDRRRLHAARRDVPERRASTARATAPTTPRRPADLASRAAIEIEPGDRMPLIPRHMLKVYADIQVTRALGIDADLVALSGSRRARQRERRSRGGRRLLSRARAPPTRTPSSTWARAML